MLLVYRRTYNNYKYINIQERSTSICKANAKSMKEEINSNTIIVGDFNIPLTPMDRSTKHKIREETQTLNHTINQLDLINIYRTFQPQTVNFTFFSSAHRIFSRIDHILGHLALVTSKKLKSFQASFLITVW